MSKGCSLPSGCSTCQGLPAGFPGHPPNLAQSRAPPMRLNRRRRQADTATYYLLGQRLLPGRSPPEASSAQLGPVPPP